jgi:hypothetical protein
MCLDRTTTHIQQWKLQEGNLLVGWKTFREYNKQIQFQYFNKRVKTNTWIKDTSRGLIRIQSNQKIYPKGFHIYLKHPDESGTRKVYYKKPVAYGYQYGLPVVVARELFVPRKKRGQ